MRWLPRESRISNAEMFWILFMVLLSNLRLMSVLYNEHAAMGLVADAVGGIAQQTAPKFRMVAVTNDDKVALSFFCEGNDVFCRVTTPGFAKDGECRVLSSSNGRRVLILSSLSTISITSGKSMDRRRIFAVWSRLDFPNPIGPRQRWLPPIASPAPSGQGLRKAVDDASGRFHR